MNSSILNYDPILYYHTYQNKDNDQMRYAELFYKTKRKNQILFILKQYSLLKNKNGDINNFKFPIMNMHQWRKIYEMVSILGPIISKFREYKTFQLWLMMIRCQKIITINFIRFLGVRKGIILRSVIFRWSRALRLKRYYNSIPVFPSEDLKLRAFRAFVILRLRKKRDNKNIDSARQASNYILISKTFDLWREKSKLKRLFMYFTKRYLSNLLRKIFLIWVKNKRIHRRLVYLYDRLYTAECQRYMWKAFKKWQSKFFDQRILCKKSNKLVRSIIQMKKRRLFRKWQWAIEYLHYIHENESLVRKKSSSFSWERCFIIWRQKYAQKIQLKGIRKNQILALFLIIKRKAFDKWKSRTNDIIIKRKKIQTFHSKLYDTKFINAFFSIWKKRYNSRKIMKMNWLKATNKWHHSLISSFFKNWHFESKASKKYSLHLLKISFLSFCKYHQHVIRIKYVLFTTYKLYQHYLQKNMISHWRSVVIQKKEMLNLQKRFQVCVLLDSFVQGSSNNIMVKRKHDTRNKEVMIDIKPAFTNDEKIAELTIELKKIQKQISDNKSDMQLHQKYIQIAKQINKLQK